MAGCQSSPGPSRPSVETPAEPTRSAQQRSRVPSIGSTTRLTLAQRERELKRTLALAERQLVKGSTTKVLELLNSLVYDELSPLTMAQLHVLKAKAYVRSGDALAAYRALTNFTLTTLEHWTVLQQICSQLSLPQCRANSLIAIQTFAGQSAPLQQDEILHALLEARRTPDYEHLQLATAQITPIPEPDTQTHRGWHALADALITTGSRSQTLNAWLRWQEQWPDHPAALMPPTLASQLATPTSASLALMLPLTGRLANVGRAVRDGFIAAYLAESNTLDPATFPELHIFDSAKHNSMELIRLARAARADVLVGPLLKTNVDAFAAFALVSETPTLLLNYLPEAPSEEPKPRGSLNLLQLGTAIEDEAQTLAAYMGTNQHERIMVIHNNSAWANRALRAFQKDWSYPLYVANFENLKQLTNAVGEVMEVAASTARKDRVAALLGESLEFLPRARQDLDAVLALTTGFEAAALTPALQFHFAEHLPVYATSQSLRDATEPQSFTVTELPALAKPNQVEQSLINTFSLGSSALVDLYALGLSAYQMATWTPMLTAPSNWRDHFTLQSPIGLLRLNPSGRLSRTLSIKPAPGNQRRSGSGATGLE